ncbi:MAG: hypothetical protein TREMPRED_005148 [Tremellales sp. Tagirdzhanova-0007]|nr:MAG: hypothetical protein TREMPRED_005148 [Tremellales sp. Tagirdzhanova-0007]
MSSDEPSLETLMKNLHRNVHIDYRCLPSQKENFTDDELSAWKMRQRSIAIVRSNYAATKMAPTLESEIDECTRKQKRLKPRLKTMLKMGIYVSAKDQKRKDHMTDVERKLKLGPINGSSITSEMMQANLKTASYWNELLGRYRAPVELSESIEFAEFFAHETRPVRLEDYDDIGCGKSLDEYKYLEREYDKTIKTISKNSLPLSETDEDTLMYVHTHMRKIKDEVTAMCARSAEFKSLIQTTEHSQ